MGLATVYGIIKQSGGYIDVVSEPGKGATFQIYLPRLAEVVETNGASPVPGELPPGTETVLLVEDEIAVRTLARLILQKSGYTVLEATHGYEAMRIGQQHHESIHLLLTDVVMPEMGGRELAERLTPLHPAMKVIFMSGYTDDAVVRHGVQHAETNFLQKPFSPIDLARTVRKVLD
jgi:CheY-like chemotaxis protein